MDTGTLVPLGGKAVIGRLSARRYDPGKVAPGGFHSRTGDSLITPLPFAIAQHPHPRESERWLLPLLPLPVGRAGWGISANRPMKPVAPRPGSGQKQGGRAHTHTDTLTHSHILSRRARTHTCTSTPRTARGEKNSTGPPQDPVRKPTSLPAKRAAAFSHSPLITSPSSSPTAGILGIQKLETFRWEVRESLKG